MSNNPRSILAQHAKTTKLLGVDFLPIGTPPDIGFTAEPDPTPDPTPDPKAEPSRPEFDKPDSIIESKPVHDFAPKPVDPSPNFSMDAMNTMDPSEIRAAYESHPDPQSKLDALRDKYISDAPHARFNTTFKNIVFGEGSPTADLMFVGEAPGQNEDETGRPFVGRAGELLDKMIGAMGLSRESVYIANVLKTRPPNNATPTPEQAHLCAPYLAEQIRIISPKVIVALGLPSTHLLLNTTKPMRSLRGEFYPFPADTQTAFAGLPAIELMPTYHPAFLLRAYTEDNRRKVWSDLTKVMDKLGLSKP
ncbi:MAG: uracil-DNA glycosylase [Phycisphaerales bacterium]|nr:uracil-DNA glycosylase [Phycisphaerales bacterium]